MDQVMSENWAIALFVAAVAQIVGGFTSYLSLRDRLTRIETKVGPMWARYNSRRHDDPEGEAHDDDRKGDE